MHSLTGLQVLLVGVVVYALGWLTGRAGVHLAQTGRCAHCATHEPCACDCHRGRRHVHNVSKERLGWRYWPTVYWYALGRFIRHLFTWP